MNHKSLFISILMLSFLFSFQVNSATFRTDSLYSKWIIDSRMGDFRNKTTTVAFKTPTTNRTANWDYVNGLVAKSILKAYEQYKTDTRCAYYFTGIQDFADNTTMTLGASNIDDLNAGKIFFELYRIAIEKGQTTKAATYKTKATTCRNTLKNNHTRIGGTLPGKGGFWHKSQYINQMWLDGLFMGPAMYAEWQGSFGAELGSADNTASWNDIALQFDTIFKYTWDTSKKLNYHAWSAEPLNSASSYWANPVTGRSQEFWGRGMGWFFAALVDVLEFMPTNHPARTRLVNYANLVADGLKSRQDAVSGCWYQLLQYNSTLGSTCGKYNYLESSASSMFTYSYFKGIRLGIFDSATYLPVANKAYQGLISKFVVEESNGKIKLISSCESAGLSSTRKGDANYYLCGSDVTINNNTEGKVLGSFIMASLEYEKTKMCISPTIYSVSGSTTICNGSISTITLNGSQNGVIYQLFKNSVAEGSTIQGTGNPLTWNVTTTGTYSVATVAVGGYCKTYMSNNAVVTVNASTSIISQSTNAASYSQNTNASPLTINAVGSGLTYQWYKNSVASNVDGTSVGSVNGGQTNSYTPVTTTLGTTYYYCIVSGTCGTLTSNVSGAITVNPLVPIVALTSGSNPLTTASSVSISPVVFTYANVLDDNNVSASWYTDNTYTVAAANPSGLTLAINTTNKTITLSGTPVDVGSYYYKVAINETNGNSIQASIIVTPPAPTIVLTNGTAVQSLKAGLPISNIVYTMTNTTGATIAGLPSGLTASYNNGSYIISGTILTGTTPAAYVFTVTATPLEGYTGIDIKVTGTITVVSSSAKILYLTASTSVDVKDTKLYPMLKSNTNYVVTVKKAATTAPASSTYSTYDLIIISESISSTNAEIIALKNVDKPILSLKSFVYNSGSNRWNWGIANDGKANNGTVTVNQLSHPIFSGITLTNGTFNLLSGAATKGVQPVDLTNIGGITLAKAPKNASPYTPAVAIHDVPASVRGVANSKFLLVGICNDSYAKMTTDALTLFRNAIEYLISGTQYQLPVSVKSIFEEENVLNFEDTQNKGVVISSDNNQLISISDTELKHTGSVVNIFNSAGQLIQSKQLTGTYQTFGKFTPGLFLVRINNKTSKVIVNN